MKNSIWRIFYFHMWMILHIHVYKSIKGILYFLFIIINPIFSCNAFTFFILFKSCHFIKVTTCIYDYIFFFPFYHINTNYIININILQIYYINIKLYNHINYKIIKPSYTWNCTIFPPYRMLEVSRWFCDPRALISSPSSRLTILHRTGEW